MSDEEDWDSDDPRRKKIEEPLPEYTIRFTDMSDDMVKKAIRCKYNSNCVSSQNNSNSIFIIQVI